MFGCLAVILKDLHGLCPCKRAVCLAWQLAKLARETLTENRQKPCRAPLRTFDI